nr:hypothetical protein GCM10025730_39470 [Promicromonospora thailandica]
MFAVTATRTYRAAVSGTSIVTVLPDAGSNRRWALAASVVKDDPSAPAWIESVCVRASHPAGSLSTTSSTVAPAPRSTWAHCGRLLLVDSQYVAWLPSVRLSAR